MSEFARASAPASDLSPRARTADASRRGPDPLVAPGRSNQAVQRLLHEAIQAKLEVNQPDDSYEREADATASRVMRAGDSAVGAHVETARPRIQRMTASAKDELRRRPALLDSHEDEAKRLHREKEEAERKVRGHDAVKHGAAAPEPQKKKHDESAKVRTKRASARVPVVTPETESAIDRNRGTGASLDHGTRAFFEDRFGRDLSHVRVHSDAQAAHAARELGAHAFTTDRDIFFASGRYEPSTTAGRSLLAHELTHTVQQSPGPTLRNANANASARPGRAGGSRAPGRISRAPRSVARATAAPPASTSHGPVAEQTHDPAAQMPVEEVALDKSGEFAPSPAISAWLAGKHAAPVRVRFGKLASGTIKVSEHKGAYTANDQAIELTHPALESIKEAGFQPVLVLSIGKQNRVKGYVTIQPKKGQAIHDVMALTQWIQKNAEAMGWHGLDELKIPKPKNELADGTLTLEVPEFAFKLGGFFSGKGKFGLVNEAFTFSASAVIKVPKVTETTIDIARAADGKLSGKVDVPVAIANFTGNLKGEFANGGVSLEGMIGVRTEKMSGQVTLTMTDERVARGVANPIRTPDEIRDSKEDVKGAPKAGKKAKPGPRALAGWGEIDAHLTEWLTGKVTVVVDSEGHITVTGKFAPPGEIVLFEQRNFHEPIFYVEIQTIYGVPLVGNAGFFAGIGLDADAKLGPAKIYNIVIEGQYSTDPEKPQNFSIEGSLNISGYAGLTLTAKGGVKVTIVKHDVKVGAAVHAGAGIEGYVEATPKILYVETDDPEKGRKGEAHLQGHLEMAARPVLSLSGDLFVELKTPWWSPISDHTWTWPLGSLEYPVPSEFGIGADIDYVLGSKQLPDLKLGKVDFDSSKFMSDLMDDHVPPKSTAAEKKKGTWKGVEPKPEEPPPVKSAAPKLPAAPAKPAPKKADAKEAKPGKPATSKQPAPRKSGEPAGKEHVLKPDVERRWQEGLQAIGNMETASTKAPLTRKQLDARLAKIKEAYGFTSLTPRPAGHDWKILAAMNPREEVPGQVEGATTTEETIQGEIRALAPQATDQQLVHLQRVILDNGLDPRSQELRQLIARHRRNLAAAIEVLEAHAEKLDKPHKAEVPVQAPAKREAPQRSEASPPHEPTRPPTAPPRLPSGKSNTEADAIPMTWYKPLNDRWYPPVIHLPGLAASFEREPSHPVEIPGALIGQEFYLGVAQEFRPHTGKRFRRDPEVRDPKVVSRYRGVLRKYGYAPRSGEVQVDHAMDLAFGGQDRFDNLWPLDTGANLSAGARHGIAQTVDFSDERGNPQTGVAITDPRLLGKWFRINQISY
jgi:hypothetical protein